MLTTLRAFFETLGTSDVPPAFAPADERIAAAALLVHAMRIDGDTAPAERTALRRALQREFDLDLEEMESVLAEAKARESEAVDFYTFTSTLKRHMDEDGRKRVVGMLWEMALADGDLSEFEDNLIWRVAELLGVSTRDRMLLRRRVGARAAGAADTGDEIG